MSNILKFPQNRRPSSNEQVIYYPHKDPNRPKTPPDNDEHTASLLARRDILVTKQPEANEAARSMMDSILQNPNLTNDEMLEKINEGLAELEGSSTADVPAKLGIHAIKNTPAEDTSLAPVINLFDRH